MAKGESRIMYTVDQKIAAVLALYSNNLEFRSTAHTLHLPVQTLRIWEKQYGEQVKEKISTPDVEILSQEDISRAPAVTEPSALVGISEDLDLELRKDELVKLVGQVYQNSIQLKRLLIRRAFELLPTAKNLKDIGYILSILNDMPEAYPGAGGDDEGTNHNSTLRKLTRRMIENANKVKQESDNQQNSKQDEPV